MESDARSLLVRFLRYEGVLETGRAFPIGRIGIAKYAYVQDLFCGLDSPVLVSAINAEQALSLQSAQLQQILDRHYLENNVDATVFSILLCTTTPRYSRLRSTVGSTKLASHLLPISEKQLPRSGVGRRVEQLRKVIRERTQLHLLNPFSVSYTSRAMFFGRKKIKKTIEAYKGHIYLYGPRRIGKTSLVDQVKESSGELRLTDDISCRRAAYVDVSAMGNREEDLYTAILRSMGIGPGEVKRLHRKLRSFSNRGVSSELPPDGDVLDTVIRASNGRVIIILDEVDRWFARLGRAGEPWDALDRIRAMTDRERGRVILVGYEHLQESLTRNDFPFVGRGKGLFLGPTDQENVEALVTMPLNQLGVSLEPHGGVLHRIWTATSGRPNLVQEICSDCIDRIATDKVGKRIVNTPIVEDVIRSNDALRKMRNTVEYLRWPLAKAIAICALGQDSRFTVGDVVELLPKGLKPSLDDVELSLRQLRLRFVFEYDDADKVYWWGNLDARDACSKWVSHTRRQNVLSQCISDYRLGEWRSVLWEPGNAG